MIAGVCLLVVLTIAECRFDFSITPSLKQSDDCGDPFDTSSKLGQCVVAFQEAAAEAAVDPDYDFDNFCDEGCVDVLLDYVECTGNDVDDYDNPCDAVTVTAISTVTAILVAIAATLN